MAFPGGVHEVLASGAHEDAVSAALRETHEEVGVPPAAVSVLGHLPTLVTPTGFEIHPVVGMLKSPIRDVPLKPNQDEIAEVLWIPLSTLLKAETYSVEQFEAGPIRYTNHVFQVGPHRIWGATGAMIRNLLDRLAQPGRAAP
jgi:8-oxo-dGTP pyrophosphatase MutT (NUDIX family)